MDQSTYVLSCVPAEHFPPIADRLTQDGLLVVGGPHPTLDARTVGVVATDPNTGRVVGAAVWRLQPPSPLIPSGRVVWLAVNPTTGYTPDDLVTVVTYLAAGVHHQNMYTTIKTGYPSYVVADLPVLSPFLKAFQAAGWTALQTPVGGRSTRFVTFAHASDTVTNVNEADDYP